MYSKTSLSSVCWQDIRPLKAITYTLLLIVSLLVVSACSQRGEGSAAKPTSTPATTPTVAGSSSSPTPIPTVVGSPSGPTPAGPVNSLQTIHMIDATTGWASTNASVLRTTNGWRTWRDVTPHKAALVDAGYFLYGEEAWIGKASGLILQAREEPAVNLSHTTKGVQTLKSATLSL